VATHIIRGWLDTIKRFQQDFDGRFTVSDLHDLSNKQWFEIADLRTIDMRSYSRDSPKQRDPLYASKYSHDFQRIACRNAAFQHGFRITTHMSAPGLDGRNLSSDGLNELLAYVRGCPAKRPILVWDLSRLVRKPHLLKWLIVQGVRIVSLNSIFADPTALHSERIKGALRTRGYLLELGNGDIQQGRYVDQLNFEKSVPFALQHLVT